jgi:DnaD/phage-associated family protein
MEIILHEGDIQSKGYGIIPKLVMQDNRLTIESKAIYAYLSSYCGGGTNQAFPSVKTITTHLNISEKRFQGHVKTLKELGYITVEKKRDNKGIILHNIYIINQYIKNDYPSGQNLPVDSLRVDKPLVGYLSVDKLCTNNNSTNNNKNNNNNYNKNIHIHKENENEKLAVMTKLYESNLGVVNKITSEWIIEISKDIDVDLFKKAIDICVSKGNCNLGYIKGIIKNWMSKNIKSIEDLKCNETESKNNRKTKFHNFKETFNKYTEEELEYIIMQNQKLKWN